MKKWKNNANPVPWRRREGHEGGPRGRAKGEAQAGESSGRVKREG